MNTVACFGDSLVYGFPYGEGYSWLKGVGRPGLRLLNYGNCGETCVDIGQRLRLGRLPAGVTALLFFGGANDVLQGTPKSVSCAELSRVMAYAGEHSLPLCVVLPLISGEPAANGRLAELRAEFTALAKDRAFVLDLMPAIGETDEAIRAAYLDGFHPKTAVYERMGVYAAPLIAKWLGMEKE